MKKIVILLCVLLVLLCTTASAEISLDFSFQTDGRWEDHADVDLSNRDRWTDTIYTDPQAVNNDLPMLVPTYSNTGISSGWSEDRTVFVSDWGHVLLGFVGLEPGEYRVALFVPQANGGTGVEYNTMECREKDELTYAFCGAVSSYPGVFEDVTLVVTGNGEVYEHTFDVQVQNEEEYMIEYHQDGARDGLYYQSWSFASAIRKGGRIDYEDFVKPDSGISISNPLTGDVYTGYEGEMHMSSYISLDRVYSWEENWEFGVDYSLTNLTTGQVIASERTGAGRGDNGKFSYLVLDVELPEVWDEGEYQLSVEVFRSVYDAEQGQSVDKVSLGTDTVNFFLEKEFDPRPIYAKYTHDDLRFNLNHGWNAAWNEDYTYLTLTDAPNLHFEIMGMKPGVTYRCALIGKTVSGEEFCCPLSFEAESATKNTSDGWVNISYQSGVYTDLTLMAYGGGEFIAYTFDCEVKLPAESEQVGVGNIFGSYEDRDYFGWVSEYNEEIPQPQSGYAIYMPENCIFTGYTGNVLSVPYIFSEEYSGLSNISMTLTEEATGKVIKEANYEIDVTESHEWNLGLIIYEDFAPGAYILHTSSNGQEMERRIILQKERTPNEIYAEYWAKRLAVPKYSAQGVIVYSNEENSIIPEIRDYLASMSRFDTDMFNQFLRYGYAPVEGMMNSFALHSPNVAESEKTIDQEDLLFTANWLLRDVYSFQLNDMKYYSDARIIDQDALHTFFGDSWKEMAALDHATGMAMASDGTAYTWMPVYYADEQGGFANDELYLFVYVLHRGADSAYLDATGFFNPEFYNEYHTTQLLITDQKVVAGMLNKLNGINTALGEMEDTTKYTTLHHGDEGEFVRRLQKQLRKMGYLTTSVDAVFSNPVKDAVLAWQKDMGLQQTGSVTAEMQRMLHDSTEDRQLLMTWLDGHQ